MKQREIKFRGLRKIDLKFVYGDLIQNRHSTVINDEFGHDSTVKIETVGQFTGLTDKNGTEIYEGDIITAPRYINGYGIIVWSNKGRGWMIEVNGSLHHFVDYVWDNLAVIGNIHENPELLEQ